jgi:hypothetical protein
MDGSIRPAGGAHPSGDRRPALTAIGGLLVFLMLVWLGGRSDDLALSYRVTGQQTDYYNALVDGFLKGQLHLDVEVHPDLASDDPVVRRSTPFLLDANLYQGRYYLYYGVVPAVLLMLPYSALTGHDLATNVVVLIFLGLGYGCAITLFDEVRRRHFPALSRGLHLTFLWLLGLGSALPFLAIRGIFYEVPIAAGYACAMAGLWAVWRALQTPASSLRALALGSLCLSLAVGCRPNYVFALPALLIPAALAWQVLRQLPDRRAQARRLLVALLLPSVTVGALLVWYNHARFGHPLETGFRYGMNTFFWTGFPLASWRFVWPNFEWYYLSPASLSPYFPFFFPIAASFRPVGYYGDEVMHGQLMVTLLLLATLAWGLRSPTVRQRWRALGPWWGVLGWTTFSSLAFMLALTMRGNRYMVDFHASLVLGLACAAGVVATDPGRLRRASATSLGVLAFLAGLVGLGSSLQQFDDLKNARPATYARLARLFNQPSARAAQLGWLRYGPVSFEVTFESTEQARVEPLLVAGTPYYSDGLFVGQHPGNLIQFHFDHHGYGGPSSDLITIEPGRTYRIDLVMGAFYPPRLHPYFDGRSTGDIDLRKELVRLSLDGKEVISARMSAYDAPPWSLQTGKNRLTAKPFADRFTGRVTSVTRTTADHVSAVTTMANTGAWLLDVEFAPAPPGTREPVLSSGRTGAGNLLLVESIDDDHVRFSVDFWGYGLSHSEPVPVDKERLHLLGLFVGASAGRHSWPEEWDVSEEDLARHSRTLRVWLNDQLVWTTMIEHHVDSYDSVALGSNDQGFSTATGSYSRLLLPATRFEADLRQFLEANLAAPPASPE